MFLPWRAEQFDHRHRDDFLGFLDAAEGRRLHDLEPDIETDRDQDGADQEGDAPAPGEEVRVAQKRQNVDHARAQQQTGGNADLRPASVKAAVAARRMLDRQQHCPAPFAADADALEDAQHQQQDRRPDADRGVGRQQADQERRDAHDQHGHDQHRLATDAIAIVAEYDAANRAGDEADEESRVCEQRAHQRIEVWKKQFVENERRHHPEQKEIVPLDCCTDGACERDRLYRHSAVATSRFCLNHGRLPSVI